MEELKKLNPPPAPTVPPAPVPCPTAEQWEELLTVLNSQYRLLAVQNHLLEQMLSKLMVYATKEQAAEMTRQLSMIQASIEQAGRQNERRRLRLPRLHLPELSTAILKGAALTLMALAAFGILLFASATLWSVIRPLLQPLL